MCSLYFTALDVTTPLLIHDPTPIPRESILLKQGNGNVQDLVMQTAADLHPWTTNVRRLLHKVLQTRYYNMYHPICSLRVLGLFYGFNRGHRILLMSSISASMYISHTWLICKHCYVRTLLTASSSRRWLTRLNSTILFPQGPQNRNYELSFLRRLWSIVGRIIANLLNWSLWISLTHRQKDSLMLRNNHLLQNELGLIHNHNPMPSLLIWISPVQVAICSVTTKSWWSLYSQWLMWRLLTWSHSNGLNVDPRSLKISSIGGTSDDLKRHVFLNLGGSTFKQNFIGCSRMWSQWNKWCHCTQTNVSQTRTCWSNYVLETKQELDS